MKYAADRKGNKFR